MFFEIERMIRRFGSGHIFESLDHQFAFGGNDDEIVLVVRIDKITGIGWDIHHSALEHDSHCPIIAHPYNCIFFDFVCFVKN
jgi:hypothetical protein